MTPLLLYAVARGGGGLLLLLRGWQESRDLAHAAAQSIADASAVLFVLGYGHVGLRTAIGGWWAALFLFAAIWETRRWWKRFREFPSTDTVTYAEGIGGAGMLAWEVFAVAPPLLAGFFLFFDVLFPNQWAFVTA